jgi:glycosyltransferase involved in cell wall biosynthesis
LNYKTAIVIFNNRAFGGAPKRYTNLFLYLNKQYPGCFYLIVNSHLFNQLKEIYDDIDTTHIRIVDNNSSKTYTKQIKTTRPRHYKYTLTDPYEIDRNTYLPRKIYWYYKNKLKQYLLFKTIERFRKEIDIKVFCGVFSGVMPLVFYFNQKPQKAGIIFSNMDSWFSEVLPDMKTFWYRKYYSFNYALENCDSVDFLSPYIIEGVRKRGVKINENTVSIAPCSFSDYSKCSSSKKKNFEIAFCARLEPDKNPLLYLEAVNVISKRHPGIKFHLLGEGSLVAEIENFIRVNNLSRVVNFSFHKNPSDIFKETTVFVSLQKNTNYPSQSVLEAMSCGNVTIATDVGDTRCFLNNNSGILIKPDKDELVNAMEFLINNEELARDMGNSAREYIIGSHTIEKYSQYFIELIEKTYKKVFH